MLYHISRGFFAAFLLSFGIFTPAMAQWVLKDSPSVAPESIEAIIALHSKEGQPGASIAVVKDGAVAYNGAFGLANVEHGITNRPSTVYNIASMAKQFTAFAIAQLVLENRLSLDDDIRRHLPEIGDLGNKVSVRNLIHHTSGLKDELGLLVLSGWRYQDTITNEDVLNLASRLESLDQTPGDYHIYSNTNYSLLASIVQRITDTPFDTWMKNNVFTPLGMSSTMFVSSPNTLIADRATGYEDDSGQLTVRPVYWYEMGPGSMYTTVEDISLWMLAMLDPSDEHGETFKIMSQRGLLNNGDSTDYAFGIVHGTDVNLETLSHGGSIPGYRSHMTVYPSLNFGVVVLSNSSDMSPSAITSQIADLHVADERTFVETSAEGPRMMMITTEDLAANPTGSYDADPESYDAFEGTYSLQTAPGDEDDFLLRRPLLIERDGERLLVSFGEPPGIPMSPIATNRF